jgi:hypothetical protein
VEGVEAEPSQGDAVTEQDLEQSKTWLDEMGLTSLLSPSPSQQDENAWLVGQDNDDDDNNNDKGLQKEEEKPAKPGRKRKREGDGDYEPDEKKERRRKEGTKSMQSHVRDTHTHDTHTHNTCLANTDNPTRVCRDGWRVVDDMSNRLSGQG